MPSSSKKASDIVDLRIARFDAQISTRQRSYSLAENDVLRLQSGRIVELLCTAFGRPQPEINWYKDGRLVSPSSSSAAATKGVDGAVASSSYRDLMISRHGSTSFLRINNVRESDSGTYSCKAQNINGHIRKWVFVTVTTEKNITAPVYPKFHSQKSPCDKNPCNIGVCVQGKNISDYTCKCPFPYSGSLCQDNILMVPSRRNYSSYSQSTTCKKGEPTINDQLFTIFETVLVCVVASLFIGVLCYICRKYGVFGKNNPARQKKKSQATQVEINNFILVREVGTSTDRPHEIELGPESLVPVAPNRHTRLSPTGGGPPSPSPSHRLLTVIPNPYQPPYPTLATPTMDPMGPHCYCYTAPRLGGHPLAALQHPLPGSTYANILM